MQFSNTNTEEDTCFLLNRIRNGRVNLDGKTQSRGTVESLYVESNRGNISYQAQALKSIQSKNTLQNLFFSQSNMDIIQDQLRSRVSSLTGQCIGKQSYTQLEIIMRSIFLQYSKNVDNLYETQVRELNKLVLKYAVPNVVSNVRQYIGYIDDVQYNPVPLEHPEYISNTGLKGL